MNQQSLSLLVTCFTIILAFGLLAFMKDSTKQRVKPAMKRRGLPISHAYTEMLHIILNAQSIEDMRCLDCLISDFYTEYEGIESYENIEAFINDIVAERRAKEDELLHVEEYEMSFS